MINNNFNPYFQNSNPYLNNNNVATNNGINWVQGVEGAKAWQLQPNSNVMLLDSENDNIFYIKVSDNVGMCTLRTFKYEEVLPEKKADLSAEYVTKTELRKEIEDVVNSMLGGVQDGTKQTLSRTK